MSTAGRGTRALPVYHGSDLPRLLCRLSAIVVVSVFASLPTLARVHDRLSTHDNASSFKLSKNLERPHEKIGGAIVDDSSIAVVARDITRSADVIQAPTPAVSASFAAPLAPRAPPVR